MVSGVLTVKGRFGCITVMTPPGTHHSCAACGSFLPAPQLPPLCLAASHPLIAFAAGYLDCAATPCIIATRVPFPEHNSIRPKSQLFKENRHSQTRRKWPPLIHSQRTCKILHVQIPSSSSSIKSWKNSMITFVSCGPSLRMHHPWQLYRRGWEHIRPFKRSKARPQGLASQKRAYRSTAPGAETERNPSSTSQTDRAVGWWQSRARQPKLD